MFRFSIRDLLWLTLVVAMGLGWFVRERQLREGMGHVQADADRAHDRAARWRLASGALEHFLKEKHRCHVAWKFEQSEASVLEETRYSVVRWTLDIAAHEPSAHDD